MTLVALDCLCECRLDIKRFPQYSIRILIHAVRIHKIDLSDSDETMNRDRLANTRDEARIVINAGSIVLTADIVSRDEKTKMRSRSYHVIWSIYS